MTAARPGWVASADLVVVGSGVAGLTAAIEARRLGLRVVVVTKALAAEGNTRWAQGGVAVVTPESAAADGDTVARHVADTLTAGAGLTDEAATRAIIGDGPAAVATLRARGAVFDTIAGGRLARTREGGHTAFRVVHAGGDATGAEIERALLAAAATVPVLERHEALDVLRDDAGRVTGLVVRRHGAPADGGSVGSGGVVDGVGPGDGTDGAVGVVAAPAVLLATGGLGQVYAATTNPEVATGDGLALALRAGATVSDIEFVQFHPTVLYTPGGPRGRRPLVTEAVRGEGAVLVDVRGDRVMAGVHPLADLAPRDVVAAAISRRAAETGADHVLLDATHLDGPTFAARFPTVHAACRAAGIDPTREPIPVAPAAHYACGGVDTTVDGRTAVPGLYAAGEVARTGLHGANRLASNSLLEGLVVGTRAAAAVAADLATGLLRPLPPRAAEDSGVPAHGARGGGGVAADVRDEPAQGVGGVAGVPGKSAHGVGGGVGGGVRDAVQRAMSRHAGIGRDADGLAAALATVEAAAAATPAGEHEDAALVVAATAVLRAAAERTESRGCHVRVDHPRAADAWLRAVRVRLVDGRVTAEADEADEAAAGAAPRAGEGGVTGGRLGAARGRRVRVAS